MAFEYIMALALWRISFNSRFIVYLRPRPRLGSFDIPPEIILMIIAYLDRPLLLSLILTCRTFYYVYYLPRSLLLSPTEKQDFLILLEKDATHYYFCHFCLRLQIWRRSWFRHFNLSVPHYYLKHKDTCREKYQIDHHKMPTLLYPFARVVMNRHLYGAAHGPPVKVLSTSTSDEWEYRYRKMWKFRIIDDEIFLSSDITMYTDKVQGNPRRSIDCTSLSLCPHLTTSRYFHSKHQLPELVAQCSTDDLVSCHESIKTCPECLTDYCISII